MCRLSFYIYHVVHALISELLLERQFLSGRGDTVVLTKDIQVSSE